MTASSDEKRASALYASAVGRRLRQIKAEGPRSRSAFADADIDVLVYDLWQEAGETPEVLTQAFKLCERDARSDSRKAAA